MNTPARLGGFTLGLAAAFGAALGVGHLAGPVGAADRPSAVHGGMEHDMTNGTTPGGLLVSDHGYTLSTASAATGVFAFRITGPNGRAVTAFDTEHDKRMHLIVVRRDLSGFRHVHPTMDADGTWRVAAPFGGPGTYRAFADFKPTGADPLTLGIDTEVAGKVTPRPLPAPAATASADGYTVALKGTLAAGRSSRLDLTISRDGRPVTDLQPYLAAYGHLVALREGDLAYLHVHPDGEPGDGRTRPGPTVTFHAEAPSAGTYRLYLDFQHDGAVHTAEFTVTADAATRH
ncbi:hypothetical protein [Actinoallomurus acaciae]|uniref:Secreted protein n=1 Tax=Actinoallomurus acaciae TaxID=502577 RepID=A0ABV5Y8B0_9ACTN